MDKEEKDMATTQERLVDINKKIDSKIDDFWAQAEKNLLELEEDYKKRKEGGSNTHSK